MAPADFFPFPKHKLPVRGTRFQSIEDIKENSRRELMSIPENAFKKCFDDRIIRWHKCIISGEEFVPFWVLSHFLGLTQVASEHCTLHRGSEFLL